MCGFIGSVRWHKADSQQRIGNLLDVLVHRGPDAGHVATFGPAVFGHRRLSILDPSARADQPMLDQARRRVVVFNGEIYNFKEMRADLQQAGVVFETEGDTEVILEAWARWGDDFVERLVGMFTLALWDIDEQRLLLVRDRAGEKPLFYAWLDDGIIFASELKALRRHPDVSATISTQAISQYLSLNYILSDCSILHDVHKLSAAHKISINISHNKKNPAQPQRYWHLHTFFHNKLTCSETEAKQQLYELLQQSIAGQSVSDVPLGTFLSGGIDSSAITAILARQHTESRQLKTFSMGFAQDSFNELAAAKHMAEMAGTDHYDAILQPDIIEALPKIIYHADEPFADTSIIPMYLLAQMTRQHVTVALSGDGSDEIFSGYVTNEADLLHGYLQHVPPSLINISYALIQKILPVSFNKISLDYKLRQFFKAVQLPFDQAHFSWRQIFSDQEKYDMLSTHKYKSICQYKPFESVRHFYDEVRTCHPLDQAAYVDFKTWLVDDILVKVDRATMAHSLETRAPFLDHRLIEFAAQLPVKFKMKGLNKKYILKKAMASIVPRETLRQKKKGFNAPISDWLTGPIGHFAREITYSQVINEWFSQAFIEKLWYEHHNKIADHGLKLFSLTCLGLWLQQAQDIKKVD